MLFIGPGPCIPIVKVRICWPLSIEKVALAGVRKLAVYIVIPDPMAES